MRWVGRGRQLVLAYHNVLPLGEAPAGDRSLHLRLADFQGQLDALQACCAIVPLGEVLVESNECRPRVALTFDDGYRGAVALAVPELSRRGLPATLFVAPGLLGDQTFWWDELAEAVGRGEVPRVLRNRALAEWAGKSDRIRAEAQRLGLHLDPERLPPWCRSASESELAAAAAVPGISFAAHSWTHPNLSALSEDELLGELTRPLRWLRERFPASTIPWLAYPYGLESPTVRRRVESTGYTAALRVDGGWLPRDGRELAALPRLNVPAGMGLGRFRSRLAALPWD